MWWISSWRFLRGDRFKPTKRRVHSFGGVFNRGLRFQWSFGHDELVLNDDAQLLARVSPQGLHTGNGPGSDGFLRPSVRRDALDGQVKFRGATLHRAFEFIGSTFTLGSTSRHSNYRLSTVQFRAGQHGRPNGDHGLRVHRFHAVKSIRLSPRGAGLACRAAFRSRRGCRHRQCPGKGTGGYWDRGSCVRRTHQGSFPHG
jgi:hypothetical protein